MITYSVSEWKTIPHGARSASHCFAVSDLHGQYPMAEHLIDQMVKVAKAAGPKPTRFISCGDAIDRGLGSIKCTELLMSLDDKFGKVDLLCGNHEIMVLDAWYRYGIEKGPAFSHSDWFNWMHWGGESVYKELSPDGTLPYHDMMSVGMPRLEAYIRRVASRQNPSTEDGDLLFIHAGLVPGREIQTLELGPQDQVVSGEHWAWMREPFLSYAGPWMHEKQIIVHGHTMGADRCYADAMAAESSVNQAQFFRRFNLDMGGYEYGQLTGVEFNGDKYRVHHVKKQSA